MTYMRTTYIEKGGCYNPTRHDPTSVPILYPAYHL